MSKIQPAQVERMRAYRRRGFSGNQIARFMGLNADTVRRHLAGMPMPLETKEFFIGMRNRALRQQGFIDQVNRCLAEVRA